MNAKFLKRWTAWLLPLLVLRAFIPVGFMLTSGTAGLQLTFCPSIVLGAGAHTQHAHTQHAQSQQDQDQQDPGGAAHQNGEHSSHARGAHAPCPFGLIAATTTVEPTVATFAQPLEQTSFQPPIVSSTDRRPTDRLRIRGPPSASLQALI